MQAVGLPVLLPLHKELILGRANKAHTSTVLAVAPIVRIEASVVEVHAVRADTIEVRSRPVVALGTDEVDICPVAVARSRQEDCSVGLKLVCPVALRYAVAAKTRIGFVGVAQAVVTAAPIVGKKYHAIYSVYYCFSISYSTA